MKTITEFILFAISIAGCISNSKKIMNKFHGMWKLDKYESYDTVSNKWNNSSARAGYTGYILYDGVGHMGVQLLPPSFKELANNQIPDSLNMDELKLLLRLHTTSFCYFGTYDIKNGNIIAHHRLSSNNPNEWGTTINRNFEFRNDTLILTASELIGNLKTRLRWIKITN
jgi:Lipocalin-like domain